jgi:hypothetical protein
MGSRRLCRNSTIAARAAGVKPPAMPGVDYSEAIWMLALSTWDSMSNPHEPLYDRTLPLQNARPELSGYLSLCQASNSHKIGSRPG